LLRKAVCGILLILLFIVMFLSAINIKPAKAEWTGTVYIRADGSIDPPDAPITTLDNITYTLTDNITSSGDGIVVERNNIIIDGNGYTLYCTGGYDSKGIYLNGRSNVTIKNINIQNFTDGIRLDYSSNNTINGSNIANNWHGIRFEYSLNNSIFRNSISHNGGGIRLQDSSNNIIYGNSITENTWWYGIGLYSSDYNSIGENNIVKNAQYGILIDSSHNNIIRGNSIANNGYAGTLLEDSSNNNICRNRITNNSDGMRLWGSVNNCIYENNLTENMHDGISFGVSKSNANSNNNNIYMNNIVANNKHGVDLFSCSNNHISGNNIRNNGESGVHFAYAATSNIIYENNIIGNKYGISQWYSSNKFYHNNFINNTQQVYSYAMNIWDDGYPSGGNYWSDYTGVDLFSGPYQNETGSDGIGDTPYIIDENNIDRYPLMGSFNSFNTSLGCPVDVISNSTIEDLRYFESNGTIIMHVSNMTANQAFGFCRLTIPHDVMSPPYTVKVNGTEVEYEIIYENYTEGISIIYFTYEHSRLEIMVMPEFPSATILTLLMLTSLIVTILLKKKRKTKAQQIPKFPRTAQYADES